MNCHKHPDLPVARECRMCHNLICTECVVEVGEHAVCKSCLAESLILDEGGIKLDPSAQREPIAASAPSGSKAKDKASARHDKAVDTVKQRYNAFGQPIKSGFLTVLFSCLPGLGHYYLGLQKRGLNLMILFFGIIFLNSIVPNSLHFPLSLGIPILWFYSQFDALKHRTQINNGEPYTDEPIFPQLKNITTASWFGWGLAILGIFALFYNVLNLFGIDYRYQNAIKEMVAAGILLVLGYMILKGKSFSFLTRSNRDNDDHTHA